MTSRDAPTIEHSMSRLSLRSASDMSGLVNRRKVISGYNANRESKLKNSSYLNSDDDDDTMSLRDLPKLDNTITPWKNKRNSSSLINIDSSQAHTGSEFDRDQKLKFNEKRSTGSIMSSGTLFSKNGHDSRTLTKSANNEFSENFNLKQAQLELTSLKQQVSTYKVRIVALNEIIKQMNRKEGEPKWQNAENNSTDVRNSFYDKLLNTISHNDDIDALHATILELERDKSLHETEISELKLQSSSLKQALEQVHNEYQETLNFANEHLENTDTLAKILDELIDLILKEVPNLLPDEKDALEKTKTISSSFFMVKMNTFDSTIRRLIPQLKAPSMNMRHDASKVLESNTSQNDMSDHGNRSSDAFSEDENIIAMANSTTILKEKRDTGDNKSLIENRKATNESLESDLFLDTKLEIAIETLHKEYDEFLSSIKEKLNTSALLEGKLSEKLREQENLLINIANENEKDKHHHKGSNALTESYCFSSNWKDTNQQRSNGDTELAYSYQGHIDKLNELIATLKENYRMKETELFELHEKLATLNKAQSNESRAMRDLNDQQEIFALKEQNWESLLNELEEALREEQNNNDELARKIRTLENELASRSKENERCIESLKKESEDLNMELEMYREDIPKITVELENAHDEKQRLMSERKKLENIVYKLSVNSDLIAKYEIEFKKLKEHLLLHLKSVFDIISKAIQERSVNQSITKLEMLSQLDGFKQLKAMQPKLESLYNFTESAIETITESYIELVTDRDEGSNAGWSINGERELKFRIDELERKWISERERRKLDANAAEVRIRRLEKENDKLRQQLFGSQKP